MLGRHGQIHGSFFVSVSLFSTLHHPLVNTFPKIYLPTAASDALGSQVYAWLLNITPAAEDLFGSNWLELPGLHSQTTAAK